MAQKLSLKTLPVLSDQIDKPGYSRDDLSAGILHIGVGNFHRAHQAVFLDELFSLGVSHDWGIVGAGIMPFDEERRKMLMAQDWLSTVVEFGAGPTRARITGAMVDFCPCVPAAIIDQIADPNIRIVSLTITEGGYYLDGQGDFDAAHSDMVHDAANPETPRGVFGILLAGLLRRRNAGHPPPTVLSCDNLPENGRVTRQALVGMAGLISADLQNWVADSVAFPNSMVDRITPATSDSKREVVRETFEVDDNAPVVCEPFRQWVMEDNFPLGRPQLEQVGVKFVEDVTPYETMKLRILNAGHAAIAYPAALLGYECVHEAMADDDIRQWLIHLMKTDVMPILDPIEGVDYHAYLMQCVERFSNPAVRDTIARLSMDASNRQPKFILPSIRDALAKGGSLENLALELALWCRFVSVAKHVDSDLQLFDEREAELFAAAERSHSNPAAFLEIADVFGELSEHPELVTAFARQLRDLNRHGTRAVLRSLTEAPS